MLPIAAALLLAAAAPQGDDPGKMINDPNPASFNVYGVTPAPRTVVDEGVQGQRALPLNTSGKGEAFAVGVSVPINQDIKAGDHLTMMFYAKLSKADPGVTTTKITGGIQLASAPYSALFSDTVEVPVDWKLFQVSGVADKNYPKGTVNGSFQVNTGHQTISMGLVAIFDKGK